MKPLFAAFVALLLAPPTLADSGVRELRRSTPCCWESLFRQGAVDCEPVGPTRGVVLYSDGNHPRVKARIQGTLWKGKSFHCDGTFSNRWLGGVKAGGTSVCVEPSWLDGQPCFVAQYPPDALIFGNVRDELRQIEPGVWLGRSYDGITGEPKNWFVLRRR
jgi:hypothetical protein